MKRILSLVLILLVFTLTFTACFDQPEQTTENVVYDVQLGLQALKGTYQNWNSDNVIKGDMDLENQVQYRGVFYTVTWATDCESATLTQGENGKTKLSVTKGETVVDLVLVATVSAPNCEPVSHTFNLKIAAAMSVMSHEEYIATAKGESVEVAGIVTFINTSKGQLYLEDLEGKGGYYIYTVVGGADAIASNGIEVGMTIKASGTKDIYNGTQEVKDAALTVVDSTKKELTTFDITDKFVAATSEKDAEITAYLGAIVTIKNVVIGGNDNNPDGTANKYYYYFELDGVKTYLRLADSCGLPAEDLTFIKEQHIAHNGWTANITGRVDVYSGAFYLVPVSADAIEYLEAGCEHNYEAVVTDPTCLAAGYTTHTCSLCGASYTDSVVEALEHDWTETTACTKGCGEYLVTNKVTLTADNMGLGAYAAGTVTVGGVEFGYTELGSFGDGIQMRQKNGNIASLWNNTAFSAPIAKIELVYSATKDTYNNSGAFTFKFGNSTDALTESVLLDTVKDTKTYTVTPNGEYTYFNMTLNLTYSFYWDSITIVLVDGTVITGN